jgi:hypothetical protein
MRARIASLGGLAAAALALLACGGDREQSTVQTTPAVEVTAQPVQVTQVDLGSAVGPDKRVTAPKLEFAPTEPFYVSVVTEGTAAAATLVARWTFENGELVNESMQTLSPSGTAVTEFHISKADGWPKGKYQVEILLNGVSTQTKEFVVK